MINIRSVPGIDFKRIDTPAPQSHSGSLMADGGEEVQPLNLQQELSNAAEEMADILSAFGRFSKMGRKNDSTDNDFVSAMLEDQADEKLDTLIRQVAKLRDVNTLINFARQLFPNDSDLMLALREMLLSRQLSELQKKKSKRRLPIWRSSATAKRCSPG